MAGEAEPLHFDIEVIPCGVEFGEPDAVHL